MRRIYFSILPVLAFIPNKGLFAYSFATFSCSALVTQSATSQLHARKRSRGRKNNDGGDTVDDSYDKSQCAEPLVSPFGTKQPNRKERMEMILDRDGCTCVWCRRPIDIKTATTDHLMPKIKGGPSWIENELASCSKCNKQRGHRMPLDWLEECKEKSLDPNCSAVVRLLHELDRAIATRGGQRRVRPHLARQLRRILSR
mmetsp:Transcript_6301/g.9693  ORF Transcript_6301/g.9693 Transcript_6301/m.9693 type:complete len:200 (+) Transcript_6301:192-791(+)